jgi:hypothetical protein
MDTLILPIGKIRFLSIFLLLNAACVLFGNGVPQESANEDQNGPPINTQQADLSSVSISSDSMNKVPPQDVIEEVLYFGPAAGGSGPACEPNQLPMIDFNPQASREPEPGCTIHATGCGWQENEAVTVTLIYPDGQEEKTRLRAKVDEEWRFYSVYSIVSYEKELSFSDPAGNYRLVFEGPSGRAEQTFVIKAPSELRFYDFGDKLILRNFAPAEKVRVFLFKPINELSETATLRGWAEFDVTQGGDLTILVDQREEDEIYAVLGNRSGQVIPYSPITCSEYGLPLVINTPIKK